MEFMIRIIKDVLVIILITIVPWVSLINLTKKKKNKSQKKFIIIGFITSIVMSLFTDNILPTIISLIYMKMVYSSKDNIEEKYFLRPLKKKSLKLNVSNKSYTITIAKERIKVIGMSILFRVIITLISLWFIVFIDIFGIKLKEQIIVGEFLNASYFKSIYFAILMVITAPILEEFIFRHLFYRILKKKIGKIFSAILTSLLFTLLHFNLAGVIMFFAVGMFNCYLYEKYGYRAAVINHLIFNSTSLIGLILIK